MWRLSRTSTTEWWGVKPVFCRPELFKKNHLRGFSKWSRMACKNFSCFWNTQKRFFFAALLQLGRTALKSHLTVVVIDSRRPPPPHQTYGCTKALFSLWQAPVWRYLRYVKTFSEMLGRWLLCLFQRSYRIRFTSSTFNTCVALRRDNTCRWRSLSSSSPSRTASNEKCTSSSIIVRTLCYVLEGFLDSDHNFVFSFCVSETIRPTQPNLLNVTLKVVHSLSLVNSKWPKRNWSRPLFSLITPFLRTLPTNATPPRQEWSKVTPLTAAIPLRMTWPKQSTSRLFLQPKYHWVTDSSANNTVSVPWTHIFLVVFLRGLVSQFAV